MENCFEGITDQDGNPMSELNVNPFMGYRIVHKITKRILPQTQRYEIMGYYYAQQRVTMLENYYKLIEEPLDVNEYELEPVYLSELDDMNNGFLLLYSEEDKKNMELFDDE